MATTNEEVKYEIQENPSLTELSCFLENAFNALTPGDQASFDVENKGQTLKEWLDIDPVKDYLKHGFLLEARNEDGKLLGIVLFGKQNPISWPDGNKAEMFVLAVDSSTRGLGIGSKLVEMAENAAREMGAKSLILSTHVLLTADHKFYEKLGFVKIGILKEYYGNGDAVFYSKKLN